MVAPLRPARSGGANGSKSVLGFRWKWKRKWKVGAASGFRFSVTVFFCLFSTQTFLCPFSPICTVRSANGRWVFSKNYRKNPLKINKINNTTKTIGNKKITPAIGK